MLSAASETKTLWYVKVTQAEITLEFNVWSSLTVHWYSMTWYYLYFRVVCVFVTLYNISEWRQTAGQMGDLPYVEWLARKYLDKGKISRCWSDYLKVNLQLFLQ